MNNDERRRHREYMREWRERNREKNRAYQRAYYEKYIRQQGRAEEARERARTWYEDNREHALDMAHARQAARPKKGAARGEAHPNWKGDGVGYHALHTWVVRVKGAPSKCEHCGTETARRFEWANVDHSYRRVVEDWLRLCTSCHRRYDYANALAKTGGRRREARDVPDPG